MLCLFCSRWKKALPLSKATRLAWFESPPLYPDWLGILCGSFRTASAASLSFWLSAVPRTVSASRTWSCCVSPVSGVSRPRWPGSTPACVSSPRTSPSSPPSAVESQQLCKWNGWCKKSSWGVCLLWLEGLLISLQYVSYSIQKFEKYLAIWSSSHRLLLNAEENVANNFELAYGATF